MTPVVRKIRLPVRISKGVDQLRLSVRTLVMTAHPKSAPSTALKTMAVETAFTLQPRDHKSRCRRTLQQTGETGVAEEAGKAIGEKARELSSQSRPESSQHGRFYHVGALQQKRDGTDELNETLHRETGIWGEKGRIPVEIRPTSRLKRQKNPGVMPSQTR